MSRILFRSFFESATGLEPFPYQVHLAESDALPKVLHIPTGAGKTAAVLLAWLWRRRFATEDVRRATPRRLVYCLPMRILVEQTIDAARLYLTRLGLPGIDADSVHSLMGGDSHDSWLLHPESEAIIVGTQDMLLSAGLNRGYGLSRFRWPHAFGLLHSDALWVFDEIQLFGAALPTTAQLEALRQAWGTAFPSDTLWMSATLQRDWLDTVDHPAPAAEDVLRLGAEDVLPRGQLHARLHAPKRLARLQLTVSAKDKRFARELAAQISAAHRPGSLTLVILNTVDRARAVHAALGKAVDSILVHSRYRPVERAVLLEQLRQPVGVDGPGRIVVSTQVIEAGVDISAHTLITELAPWPSMVQRFGRCNRYGQDVDACVFWLDVDNDQAAPYPVGELVPARKALESLEGQSVAPADVPEVVLSQPPYDVIRRQDVWDLFDTAPDLSGSDVDVSRYIRAQGDPDVHVFWRDFGVERAVPSDLALPAKSELCPVPVGELRAFLTTRRGWVWDHLLGAWQDVRPQGLRPGMTVLLPSATGGYDLSRGWDPSSETWVNPIGPVATSASAAARPRHPEAVGDDPDSATGWETLSEHTDAVVSVLQRLLVDLPVSRADSLRLAARWHDAGKSHAVFQATLTTGDPDRQGIVWAKSDRHGHHNRRHFRHELASALALLRQEPSAHFLAAYLVAAHHGRVRLAIRSLPDENAPRNTRSALGIYQGDELPAADLGSDHTMHAQVLDLSRMELGRGEDGQSSWTEEALALLADLGPFRLAYLEALLRAADGVASQQGAKEAVR